MEHSLSQATTGNHGEIGIGALGTDVSERRRGDRRRAFGSATNVLMTVRFESVMSKAGW